MSSAELDLVGIERTITGADAADEFKRIFGFSSENLRRAARTALRAANETDDIHSQISAEGSKFYHEFVAEVRASVDSVEGWRAKRQDDNRTSPRLYRSDGLGLAFVQGTAATGDRAQPLRLRKKLGHVTVLELRHHAGATQLILPLDDFNSNVITRPQTFWLVVYYRDEDSIRLEVSLPAGVDDHGTIAGWDKRIILDDIYASDQSMGVRNEERDEDDGVTVAISER